MKPTIQIDGNDIVVKGVRGTCFGGDADPQDNGETASGVSSKGAIGVALPRRYMGKNAALRKALGDGIIPEKLPFFLPVEITDTKTGKTFSGPFIDIGPATYTGNYIDLTPLLAKKFNPKATATNFEIICDYRIIGGAKFA